MPVFCLIRQISACVGDALGMLSAGFASGFGVLLRQRRAFEMMVCAAYRR